MLLINGLNCVCYNRQLGFGVGAGHLKNIELNDNYDVYWYQLAPYRASHACS